MSLGSSRILMTLPIISDGEEAGHEESRRLPRSKRNNEKNDCLWGVTNLRTFAELLMLKKRGSQKRPLSSETDINQKNIMERLETTHPPGQKR